MTSNQADDELFTRAISGYRDAFLVRHSNLPEFERNRLWRQRISAFIDHPEKPGKRSRHDATPRTLPSSSGLPQAKRRATVRVTLVSCSRPLPDLDHDLDLDLDLHLHFYSRQALD